MADYIAIIHKEPDSSFGVSFPDFPGCVTAGDSLDEAKDMAREALAAHVALLREQGESVPAPSDLEAVMAAPDFADGVAFLVALHLSPRTVRVNITLPEDELKRIDEAARARGMSRSAFLARAARSMRP